MSYFLLSELASHGTLAVHCSNAQLGGAEKSLLEELGNLDSSYRIHFILPDEGPFCKALRQQNMDVSVIRWPTWLGWFAQQHLWWQWPLFLLFPVMLVSLGLYYLRLAKLLQAANILFSSGVKSHCLMLILSPFYNRRSIFNVRDFVEPLIFRKILSVCMRLFGIHAVCNSQRVAKDYYKSSVKYPPIPNRMRPSERHSQKPRLIFTHLGFFAPYKGQHVFLEKARCLRDQGVDAEFWLLGDVIYPAPRYLKYKEKLIAYVQKMDLSDRVTFHGIVADPYPFLQKSDVLIHCSTDPEPFGRVILEGLSAGCSVLCHEKSGVCELLEFSSTPPRSIPNVFGPPWVWIRPGALDGIGEKIEKNETPASGLPV